jgi:tripartite-type tricarboxylate transporter receptor subunit TctC
MRNGLRLTSIFIGLMAVLPVPVHGQNYPSRPVRFVVGYPAGGGVDTLARIVSQKLGDKLGQQVIVDNRPGAGGTLAADTVANAPADGYTFYFAESAILIAPAIYAKVAYDPVKSFTPVSRIGVVPLALVAHPSFAANDTRGAIAALKAKPGQFYGAPGLGTVQHLAGELFKRSASVDMQDVQFKGATPALTALIANEVPLAIVSVAPALSQAANGGLKIIGVTSAGRVPTAPDVPAISETLPGFDAVPNVFLLAPTQTPSAIVTTMDNAVQAVIEDQGVRSAFDKQGATAAGPGTPKALGDAIAREVQQWATVAKAAGVKLE